jgi:hypothetical protein
VRRRAQAIRATSIASTANALLSIGQSGDGVDCGIVYKYFHIVKPRLLPRSRAVPSQSEKAIGTYWASAKVTPPLDLSARFRITDHSPRS